MGLKLYRRHRKGCEGGHPEDSFTGEFEESRRGWKKCDCIIHTSGTLGGKFNRKQTGKTTWHEAKLVSAEYEKAKSWTSEVYVAPVVDDSSRQKRAEIERAITIFLAELSETAAFATHKKYRLLLKNFKTFSDERGYVMIDQWGPADVREFRSSWGVSPQTAIRRMSMMKPFFEYCVSNEWIERNPARAVKNPKGREASDKKHEQKLPFTDEELKRMYDACQRYGSARHRWSGDDLADFISLSIYTGLRISDVALFHVDRLQPNGEIFLRTTKAGTNVCTWVPSWLQNRIRERGKKYGPFIFGEHETKSLDVITDVWRRKLKELWSLCGPWRNPPTPHRFRHSFARILLQKPNVTVRDVAELLGNTEDMVRKHYSAWILERQARLTRVLQEAFEERPKPILIKRRES